MVSIIIINHISELTTYQYQANLAGVNCTKSDLDDLLSARTDVEILDLDDDLWYSKTYK